MIFMKKRSDAPSPGRGLLKAAASGLISLCLFAAVGCSAPLKVNYTTPPNYQTAKASAPVTVAIPQFTDSRVDKKDNGRTIGKVEATVVDMNGTKLTLSDDVSNIVTSAFRKEFADAGYAVKGEDTREDTDFILNGEIKDFRVNIGSRDEIAVEVFTKVTEKETGRVLWSGTVAEKSSKYAGVMGNTRGTISNYISWGISKVIKDTLAEITPKIANTKAAYKPPTTPAAPSVTQPSEAAPKAPEQIQEKSQPAPEGSGRIVISTVPTRSKVYINDVYYGLTPISLDIDPGVYEVVIKQKGFKNSKEKVSVRKGQFTEIDVQMEKE